MPFIVIPDPMCPSTMGKVKMFLHKVSIEKMKANQAVIPETTKVGEVFILFSHSFLLNFLIGLC